MEVLEAANLNDLINDYDYDYQRIKRYLKSIYNT